MTDTDLPDFTPVPLVRARVDGWTAARQRAFIAALAETGVVATTARAVGMGPTSAYRLRRRAGADSFVAAWDAVALSAQLRALDHIHAQAVHGSIRPRFYRGRCVGHVHRYETRLALAALRALDRAGARVGR